MGRSGRQHHWRLGRRVALRAIFSAFESLTRNGMSSYRVDWLSEYPLLSTSSPRDAFLVLRFLCSHPQESGDKAPALDPITYANLTGNHVEAKQLLEKRQFAGFTYLDSACNPEDSARVALEQQERAIRALFDEKHHSGNLIIIRSDNLHSNGYNSIRESITNLISAVFFMSKGYMVLEDNQSGPDLIAFKTSLLSELRERRFIGRGASISQLATIRAFGRVSERYMEETQEDEVIAVESESVSPRNGMKQLMGGYSSNRFLYMGFFDRRVLAAPFLSQGPNRFDVLTYDTNGLEYRECIKAPVSRDFWRSKKQAFIDELHNSIKATLLQNLTFEEIASMVSSRPSTPLIVLRDALKLEVNKILDKLENS
jgi:hypothetical protein